MWNDIRLAARSLSRHRSFAAAAVATLAIGIAAVTVVFSLLYGALLRPPPFPEPDRLFVIYRTAAEEGREPALIRWSFPRLEQLRQQTRTFEGIAAFGRADWNLADASGEPERVPAEMVSAAYFPILGVRAAVGRVFLPEEDANPGAHPVALIGHGLWSRRFGGDSAVIGRSIRVSGETLTIVGVLPRGFQGLTGRAELWIPQMMAPRVSYAEHLTTDQNFISAVGRLRPGVTVAEAETELATLGARIAQALPDDVDVPTRFAATAVSLADARVDPASRRSVLLLFGAVGALLLLGCANLAGLGLARATTRRQEVAVRLALGASRGRLVRQLLTESALLGLVGGALGVVLAGLVLGVVRPPAAQPGPGNMYGTLGNFASAGPDLAVLGFAVLASVAAVILSGLAPALQAGRTDLAVELKDRSASAGAPRGDSRAQSTLVVVEIALALVLSLGAGLLFSSLRQLQAVPLGFDPAGVLTFRIQPSEVRFGPAEAPALLDRVLAQLAAVPGVRSASVDGCAPVGPACAYSSLYIAGRPEPGREPGVTRHYVGPEHFTTLGVPLLRGRAFTNDDRADRPKVAVINQTAARRFWPGASPLGQHIWFGSGTVSSADSSAEIVGVVGDVPYGSLERGAVASVYTPYRQFTYASRTVLVKADGDPIALVPAVRRAVRQVEDLPIFAVRSMNDQLADAWAGTRFNAMFLGVFAGVALLLAVSGVYGVVSHSVSQRTRELGIRVALGASVGDVLGLVLRQGLALAGLGVVLGLVAALALRRVIRSMLFGVSPADPMLLLIQGLLLVGVALAASYVPARRAAGIDPVDALRAE